MTVLFEADASTWLAQSGDARVEPAAGRSGGPALVWSFPSDQPASIGVPVSGLPKKVLFRFWIKTEDPGAVLLGANTPSGPHAAPIPVSKSGWREITLSSQILGAGPGKALNMAKADSIGLFTQATEGGGPATVTIDSFRIEEHPKVLEEVVEAGDPGTVEPHPLMAAHPAYHTLTQDVDTIAAAFLQGKGIGISMIELPNMYWIDFDKGNGKWDWKKMDTYFAAAEKADMTFVACAGGLKIAGNPANLKGDFGGVPTPPDVTYEGDLTKLLPRYLEFIDNFFDRYGKRVKYFTLHSEGCTNYFQDRREEAKTYAKFLEGVTAHIHGIAPGVLVGACIHDVEDADLVRMFSQSTDLCTVLFQPGKGFHDSSMIEDDFELVLERAGDQKIAFNECYQNSSLGLGQSEEQQAEFVEGLFALIRKYEDRFQWVTWWSLHDDSRKIWKAIGKMLGNAVGMPSLDFMLSEYATAGLFRRDGSPKPAAKAFVKGVQSLKR